MRLKLASRKSDLARIQAYQVGEALKKAHPNVSIDYEFRASLGDQNLSLPLASMGSRGVFTEDFYLDLLEQKFDVVVHSWKDLPTEPREGTMVVATLPREDERDLLLIPKSVWAYAVSKQELRILTSSPRRMYELERGLLDLLPCPNLRLSFQAVRGNLPSRLRKMRETQSGLVLAKAAWDRLMSASQAEFHALQTELKGILSDCRYMLLPLSLFPTAPAQGALAIEVASTRRDLIELCKSISCPSTFAAVNDERNLLANYGGGCHQKIGINVLHRPFGQVVYEVGSPDHGRPLESRRLIAQRPSWPRATSRDEIFPGAKGVGFFDRVKLQPSPLSEEDLGFVVSRASAWPGLWKASETWTIWTAGVTTWRALAKEGLWVNGSFDSLGEREPMRLQHLARPKRWIKLTHDRAGQYSSSDFNEVATYRLIKRTESPLRSEQKFFYWMSASSFAEALRQAPDLVEKGFHGCGPGHTLEHLKRSAKICQFEVFLSFDDFLRFVFKES